MTFALTPFVAKFAHRVGWVDAPDARRVHTRVTPNVGGIAMFLGFVAAMVSAWGMDSFRPIFAGNSEALGTVLGCSVIFLVGQVYDYTQLGFGISDGVFGSTFYTLTGFHGAHVLGGVLMLAVCLYRGGLGQFSAEHHDMVEATSIYWHFVDVVWILLFALLYFI